MPARLTRANICSLFVLGIKTMSRDDELRAHFGKQAREFEEAVNQALAIANGDAMAAVRTLVVANIFLHEENERLRTQISSGYMRGQTNKAAS
jgi:hypothetical protein